MRRLLLFPLLLLCFKSAFPQCTGLDLTVDKEYQCAPNGIRFVVSGAPSGSSFLWDFGNGFISNADTVYEFFVNPVELDVQVQVVLPSDSICIISKPKIAKILGKPEATFTISRNKLCDGPDSVTLINNTPITKSISWIVDGTNYFFGSDTLIHYFKSTGSKNLSMVVTDTFGCRAVAVFKDVAIVHPDVILDFVANQTTGCVTKEVEITPNIDDQGENLVSYLWNFEGSNITTYSGISPPKLTFLKAGEFDINLSVETENGCRHAINKVDYLKFGDSLNLAVKLSDSILCIKNELIVETPIHVEGSYNWKFSGNPKITKIEDYKYKLQYKTPGNHKIALTLSYNSCFSQSDTTKEVKVKEVVAGFTSPDAFHCDIPHTAHLTNLSNSHDNDSLNFKWDYYNEFNKLISSSNDKEDSIVLNSWGKYSIRLIAEDKFGCIDTSIKKNFVRVYRIQPNFTTKERIACVDQIITLSSATQRSSYISPDNFNWIIYDLDESTILATSKNSTIQYSFNKPGFYNIKFYAENKIGCNDSLLRPNFIEVIEPKKGFQLSDTIICAKEKIDFYATTNPKHAPFEHSWIIENQNKTTPYKIEYDTAKSRQFKFDIPGIYDVQYIHKIQNGCYDTLTRKSHLGVNGIEGNVVIDQWSGCEGMTVSAQFAKTLNIHVGSNSDTLTYEWTISPKIPLSDIQNANGPNPTFTINKKGKYSISLAVKNSVGCVSYHSSNDIYIGVVADFSVDRKKLCAGANVNIKNLSNYYPTSYDWNIYSEGNYEFDYGTKPLVFIPKSNAQYTIELIATKNGQCSDTIRTIIESIIVHSRFNVVDSSLFCAPAYAQFYATSQHADSFYWDFGDGNSIQTTDLYIANIYNRNSANAKGFDVQLISTSKFGCSDTLTIPNAVAVTGPTGDFDLNNFVGCEPLEVGFKNLNSGTTQFSLSYNDGSSLDSIFNGSHLYKISNNSLVQKFIPSIFVKDSLGCAAIFESPDTIVVYRKPHAIEITKNLDGCLPYNIALLDQSPFTTKTTWFLDSVEQSNNSSHLFEHFEAGQHEVSLVVNNEVGCADTTSKKFTAHNIPLVQIVPKLSCLNQPMLLQTTPTLNHKIVEWHWELDYPNTNYTSTTSSEWEMSFEQPGTRNVTLKVVDEFGCKSEVHQSFEISSPDSIPSGEINFVTINESNQLLVSWVRKNPKFAKKTVILNSNDGSSYEVDNNQSALLTIDNLSWENSNCISIFHKNECSISGESSISHCPVILQIASTNLFQLHLQWTSYKGWDKVDRYDIYRSKNSGKHQLIASVLGNTTSYIDSALCDEVYEYYVVAHNAIFSSNSNRVSAKPLFEYNEIPHNIKNVSVEDQQLKISWTQSNFSNLAGYELEKWDSTKNNLLSVTEINPDELAVYDENVDIDAKSYMYFIKTVDNCQNYSPIGMPGNSILLKGHNIDDVSHLYWNPYRGWGDGVKSYVIQLRTPEGFDSIGEVPGAQSSFKDLETHNIVQGQYCYRVIAKSYDNEVRSISNNICLQGGSKVWIPNAFSPNDDHINNSFKPTVQFINLIKDGTYQEYQMKIYNRWGELVFETNEVAEGWDGTYNSTNCPAQFYLYHIRVKGLDNELYNHKGLLRLIR